VAYCESFGYILFEVFCQPLLLDWRSRLTIQLNFPLKEIESTSFPQTSFLIVAIFSGIPPTNYSA
ncbi:hypothetical protein QUA82_30075, partial [Microcoleus sp. F8-D3]